MNDIQATSLRLMCEHLDSVSDEDFLAAHNAAKDWGGVTVNDYLNGAPMYDPNTAEVDKDIWELKFPSYITEEVARNPQHEQHELQLLKAFSGGFPHLENGYGDKLIYKQNPKITTEDDQTVLSESMYFLDKLKDKLNHE